MGLSAIGFLWVSGVVPVAINLLPITPTTRSAWLDAVPQHYPRCAVARAAGVAPIAQGAPGYSESLDADGDGVACEAVPAR